jgi:Leucine-rich repeat (LRR) protein
MNQFFLSLFCMITACMTLFSETANLDDSTVLDLTGRKFTTLEQIQEIIDVQDELEELYMTNTIFRNNDLYDLFLSGSFPHLKKLNLDGSNTDYLTNSSSFAENLESLSMQTVPQLINADFQGLMNLPSLKVLNLSCNRYGYRTDLRFLYCYYNISLVALEELYTNNTTTYDLQFNTFAPNIKRLSLRSSWISKKSLASIFSLKNLEFLDMGYSLSDNVNDPLVFDLRNLENFDSLKNLDLSGFACTPENIEQTQYMTLAKLEELHIDDSTIRGAQLGSFAANLKRLSLQRSNITGGDIAQIAQLKNLEALDIGSTSITGASIKKLATLPVLKELSLANTNMVKADFSNLPQSLEVLNLSESNLSLASFNTLYSLKNLKKLNLTNIHNGNITPAIIQQLREALPNCEIL